MSDTELLNALRSARWLLCEMIDHDGVTPLLRDAANREACKIEKLFVERGEDPRMAPL